MIIILPNGIIGGAERIALNLALGSIKENLDVTVCLLNPKGVGKWKNINKLKVINISIYRLFFHLKANKYDIIFATHIKQNIQVLFLTIIGRFKAKIVVRESTLIFSRLRMTLLNKISLRLLYLLYRRADIIICQTVQMMQELLSNVKLNEDKVKVVGNIIDVESIVGQSVNQLPIIHEFDKYVVVVGRLIGIKNFQLALKTLKALDPVYSLVIIGEGEKEGELREIAKKLGITERVKFLGFLDNPYPIIKSADLCLLTSLIEGFPNTLLEMMALNPRIISTRCVAAIENIPFVKSCLPEEEEVFIELAKNELMDSYDASKLLNQQRYLREHYSIGNFIELIYEDCTSR